MTGPAARPSPETSAAAAPAGSRVASLLRSRMTARIAGIALGIVFIAAAISKIADPPGFAHEVSNYALLPPSLVYATALVMPWVEILCGLALVFGTARRGAAVLVVALLLVFLAGLGTNLARGRPVDCGCFSTTESVRTPEQRLASMRLAILRDVGLLVLGFWSFRARASVVTPPLPG